MIDKLKALQGNRAQYQNGAALDFALKNDSELRTTIEQLTQRFLHRKVHGCINCYTDAYFELLTLNIEKMSEIDKCIFRLRNGAILRDVHGDYSKMATNHNLTNELAVYHLTTNPYCRIKFEQQDQIDAKLAKLAAESAQISNETPKVAQSTAKPTKAAKKRKK